MGTNYYFVQNVCAHCQRGDERLHIGKSSFGWVFALHVRSDRDFDHRYPEDLEGWRKRWAQPDSYIVNEYGDLVHPSNMEQTVSGRTGKVGEPNPWSEHATRANYAEWDEKVGLFRTVPDGIHCVANGKGTWDLHIGDFS